MPKKGLLSGVERVKRALKGEDVDRIPLITPTSVATVESMAACQSYFPSAHINAYQMAKLAAAGHEILGFDTVAPYFSILLEAAALGCEVNWGQIDSMPSINQSPVERWTDLNVPKNLLDREPVKALLTAIALLKQHYGDRVAVVGKVIGPWTLAYHLCGVQDFLLSLVLDPAALQELLAKLLHIPILLAQAELEAGADLLTWADHDTSDLVNANAYRQFLLPIHQEALKKIHTESPVILHTCGRATDRMQMYAEAGFTAFHFDSRNPVDELIKLAQDKITLVGGINNPQTLINGSIDDVQAKVDHLMHCGIKLVAPECAVPIHTPNQNLQAIISAVRKHEHARH